MLAAVVRVAKFLRLRVSELTPILRDLLEREG